MNKPWFIGVDITKDVFIRKQGLWLWVQLEICGSSFGMFGCGWSALLGSVGSVGGRRLAFPESPARRELRGLQTLWSRGMEQRGGPAGMGQPANRNHRSRGIESIYNIYIYYYLYIYLRNDSKYLWHGYDYRELWSFHRIRMDGSRVELDQ